MCCYFLENLSPKQTLDESEVAKIDICTQFSGSFKEKVQAFFSKYTFPSLQNCKVRFFSEVRKIRIRFFQGLSLGSGLVC